MAGTAQAPSKLARFLLPSNQGSDFTLITPFGTKVDGALRSNDTSTDNKGRSVTVGSPLVADSARIQSCYCYQGQARSLTIRSQSKHKKATPLNLPGPKEYTLVSGFHPDPTVSQLLDKDGKEQKEHYLVSVYEQCFTVFRALGLEDYRDRRGLIIISGSTNSMKTKLALGLMHLLLEQMMKKWLAKDLKRKPHLVTCEDNIEQYFVELNRLKLLEKSFDTPPPDLLFEEGMWLSHNSLPDYTPRMLEVDTPSLRHAIDDALRMTPAIFYGGEIRDRRAWKQLYRLAQSHLVVVTTHSYSIVNTFCVLRDSLEIDSPPQRSDLASSVLGVVHMRAGELSVECGKMAFVLPACWINTPANVTGFASDGVASIVPHFVDLKPQAALSNLSCIGRRAFARVFAGYASGTGTIVPEQHRFTWVKSSGDQDFPSEANGLIDPKKEDLIDLKTYLKDEIPDRCKEVPAICERKGKILLSPDDVRRLQEYAAAWDLRGE